MMKHIFPITYKSRCSPKTFIDHLELLLFTQTNYYCYEETMEIIVDEIHLATNHLQISS
jgi:hypothetical protein